MSYECESCTMDIDLLKILFNTGLFILIWIVQLVIYPSFSFYSEANIKKWHRLYTSRITIVVLPLMLSQLLLYIYTSITQSDIIDYISLCLVVLTWLTTFLIFVPLHSNIEAQHDTVFSRKRLTKTNWIRTVLWSLILIISLIFYAK